jgi:EF-P beta-lysylation protein EpmB
LRHLELDHLYSAERETAAASFALRVTRYYADLMVRGDPDDPLLRQVLPDPQELQSAPGFSADPNHELQCQIGSGLLHKYHGRALLVTTAACAVHCRYCFRRHYPYAAEHGSSARWHEVAGRLAAMPDVSELILSGGDPLSLDTGRLAGLHEALLQVPQLRRLRLHTRLPVVLPERVDAELTRLLAGSPLQVVMVLHINHPREVTVQLAEALQPLRSAGITMLNQSVLLKDINDAADTLVQLSELLFEHGIVPYYLHLLDPVVGAAHYQVPLAQARALQQQLLARLPGYLVPRMVREVAGASGKVPL